MGRVSGLVPSRFLTLLAHLVVVITLFWSRDSNVQACLPLKFTPEEYERQDIQLVAALSVTLGLFAVELAGFLSGVSMFNSTQSLIYDELNNLVLGHSGIQFMQRIGCT
ncbi:Transmembrane protein 107 [Tupaia chinensis]|uniref:Transmembrane protein 107 n=1 Tax=Tupaia chinensis TaxID=246437 RepID=L9KLE8_TUPCH|nr:Transmembrane protein 107 [Tupaia chinensis]